MDGPEPTKRVIEPGYLTTVDWEEMAAWWDEARGEDGEDSLQREYLRPNEAFFRSYVTFIYCKL